MCQIGHTIIRREYRCGTIKGCISVSHSHIICTVDTCGDVTIKLLEDRSARDLLFTVCVPLDIKRCKRLFGLPVAVCHNRNGIAR